MVDRTDVIKLQLDLPKRGDIGDDTNRGHFKTFHNLVPGVKDAVFSNQINNIFYFPLDDSYIFGGAPNALIAEGEKRFRNNLRSSMQKHLGIFEKLREMDLASKIVNPAVPNAFIVAKAKRYQQFTDKLCDFAWALIHDMYWENWRNLLSSGFPISTCLEKTIPFIREVNQTYEKYLNEEYNTEDIMNVIKEKPKPKDKPKKSRKSKE